MREKKRGRKSSFWPESLSKTKGKGYESRALKKVPFLVDGLRTSKEGPPPAYDERIRLTLQKRKELKNCLKKRVNAASEGIQAKVSTCPFQQRGGREVKRPKKTRLQRQYAHGTTTKKAGEVEKS